MKNLRLLLSIAAWICYANTFSQSCADPCELIGNSMFSDLSSSVYTQTSHPFYPSAVSCWKASHGSPHLIQVPGCTSGPTDPCFNDYVVLTAANSPSQGDGIYQDVNLLAGHHYIVKFEFSMPGLSAEWLDHVHFGFINYPSTWTTNPPPGWNGGTATAPAPIDYSEIYNMGVVQPYAGNVLPNWVSGCFAFDPTINYQAFWIWVEQTSVVNPAEIYLRNIRLVEVSAGPDITVCSGASTTIGSGCIFSNPFNSVVWSPSTGLSSTTDFNPTVTLTNNGSTPVTYTYTMDGACSNGSTSDQVTVTVLPEINTTITGPTQVCPGETYTYYIGNYNSGYTYNISIPGGTYTQSGNTLTVTWGTTPGPVGINITTSTITRPPCTDFAALGVQIVAPPNVPVFDGPLQACNYSSGAPYSINNVQPGVNYTWTIAGGTPSSASGTSVNITWTGVSTSITINAVYSSNPTCTTTVTYTIPPCCTAPGAWLTTWEDSNDHSSQMLLAASAPYEILNKIIGINDVFYIDQSILFTNCFIYMGPNAKIMMDPSKTLAFRNSTVQACNDMWDGIYANNGNRVDVIGSAIYDGKTALNCNGGPIINIENSSFINNYVAVKYANHNTWSPVHIFSSLFRYDQSIHSGLLPPMAGQKSLCGIKIENVFQIQIGDPAFAVFQNSFRDMNYGIHSTGSYFSIVNNEFTRINNFENPSDVFLGAGVYSTGYHPLLVLSTPGNPNPSCAYIGNTAVNNSGTFKGNTFYDNTMGVFMLGQGTTEISGNTFTDHTRIGIWSLWGANTKQITISKNTIDNLLLPTTELEGILALETSNSNSARYTFSENTIKNVRKGITAQNAFRPRALSNNIYILAPLSSNPWSWGIGSLGTLRADIQNNYIKGLTTVTTAHGIHTEVSSMAQERCNYTEKTFMGMVNIGPSPDSKYLCNYMKEHGIGYFNFNGYMNNQFAGIPGNEQSADNQWYSVTYHLSNMFSMAMPTDTWYTRNLPVNYAVDFPGPGGTNHSFSGTALEANVIQDINMFDNPLCGCTVTVPGMPPSITDGDDEGIQKTFLTSINNTAGQKTENQQWMENHALYNDLVNQEHVTGDAELISFTQRINASVTGQLHNAALPFENFSNFWFTDSIPDTIKPYIEDRIRLLESIATGNTLEQFEKSFSLSLWNAMLRGIENKNAAGSNNGSKESLLTRIYTFSEEEFKTLEEIASECAFEYGTIVYQARTLTELFGKKYTNPCEEYSFTDNRILPADETDNNYLEIAYEPSYVNVLLPQTENETGTITLFDASGKQVLVLHVTGKQAHIPTINLANGIYMVAFSAAHKPLYHSKISITH